MGQIRLMKNKKRSDGLDMLDVLDMSKKKEEKKKMFKIIRENSCNSWANKIAQIGQIQAQNLSKGFCTVAMSFKRFKGMFCDDFLKNRDNGGFIEWAFKDLKSDLNGGLMGLEVSLKKVGVLPQKWLMDEMPKTQLCHQDTKTPRYTKVFLNIGD